MPRLKTTIAEQQDSAVRQALGRIKGKYQWSDDDIAKIMGIDKKTFQYKSKDPNKFTIKELRRLMGEFSDAEKVAMF